MGLIDITHVDLANHGKDITAERIARLGRMLVIRPFRFHSSDVSGCGLTEGYGHCSGGSKGTTLGQETRRVPSPGACPRSSPAESRSVLPRALPGGRGLPLRPRNEGRERQVFLLRARKVPLLYVPTQPLMNPPINVRLHDAR